MEKSYLKVDNYIKEQILNGELKAGDKLPPERELAQILDVSLQFRQRRSADPGKYGSDRQSAGIGKLYIQ